MGFSAPEPGNALEHAALEHVWRLAGQPNPKRHMHDVRRSFHRVLHGSPSTQNSTLPVGEDTRFASGDEALTADLKPEAAFALELEAVERLHPDVREIARQALLQDREGIRHGDILTLAAHTQGAEVLALSEEIRRRSLEYGTRVVQQHADVHGTARAFAAPAPDLTAKRADLLLRLSAQLVREHEDANDAKRLRSALKILSDALWNTDTDLQAVSDVLRNIPRQEWQELPVETMRGIEIAGPLRWKDLDEKRRAEIRLLTLGNFPGCEAAFDAFTNDENAYVCALFSGGKPVASVGAQKRGEGILHFDWLSVDLRHDLKGLNGAFIRHALQKTKDVLHAPEGYGVAKAHTRALSLCIEGNDSVGYGLTDPSEEPQTHVRLRDTQAERGTYAAKKLSNREVVDLVRPLPANTLEPVTIAGKECRAARVSFHAPLKGEQLDTGWTGRDRKDLPEHEQRMYDWIEKNAGTWVLTRYVPIFASPDTFGGPVQAYAAIFERDTLNDEQRGAFERKLQS